MVTKQRLSNGVTDGEKILSIFHFRNFSLLNYWIPAPSLVTSVAGSTFLFNDRFLALNYSIAASRCIYFGFKSVCVFFNNQCCWSCEIFLILDNFARFDFNNMYSSNVSVTTEQWIIRGGTLVSFAAVIRVITQRSSREERCVTTLKMAAKGTRGTYASLKVITFLFLNNRKTYHFPLWITWQKIPMAHCNHCLSL